MPRTGAPLRLRSLDTATDGDLAGGALPDLRDRRVRQQDALLPYLAEPDGGLGVVAVAAGGDDHALAPTLVLDGVARDDRRHLAPGHARNRRRRPPRLHLDLTLARKPDHAVTGAAPARPARPGVARGALHARLGLARADERLRDLAEEPRRRVVVGLAEQRTTPRVRQVKRVLRACDPDVREPALLFGL